MRLVFCYRHLAPYHRAQLTALGRSGISVSVINFGNFHETAFRNEYLHRQCFEEILLPESGGKGNELCYAIERTKPDVVLVPGWGHNYALVALLWTVRNGVPCIVIADSQEYDRPRRWVVERVKGKVVRLFSSAFVAGRKSKEYVVKLGMPPHKVTLGCDVVDNNHFTLSAEAARRNEVAVREKLGLPQSYFLSVNRLIPEKNLVSLLNAYAGYCAGGAPGNWDLVIVGDGPLSDELRKLAADLGITDHVLFKGSYSYNEIPSFYGLASALILASFQESWGLVVNEAMCAGLPVLVSKSCGCSYDLVVDGVNGFSFDPYDTEGLTALLADVASARRDILSMGQKSRAIISEWSLEKYVENLRAAVDIAYNAPLTDRNIFDSILLNSVIRWFPKWQ